MILHYLSTNKLKSTNHRHIPPIGAAQCNSKLSLKKFNLKKTFTYFFNTVFQKVCKKIKNQRAYFGKIGRFLSRKSTSNFLNNLQIHQVTFDWDYSPGRGDDSLLGGIHPAVLLQTKTFRAKKWISHGVWLYFQLLLYYILYNNSTLTNCFHFCKYISN